MGRKRSRPGGAFLQDEDYTPGSEPEEEVEEDDDEEELVDEDEDVEGEEDGTEDEEESEDEEGERRGKKKKKKGKGGGGGVSGMGRGDHECEVCGAQYTKAAYLTDHMRTHTDEKPYVCPVEGCGQSYARKDHLERHLNSVAHLNDGHIDRKTYECSVPGCGKVYYNVSHLADHTRTHSAPRPFVCTDEGCSESFIKRCQLRQHQVAMHGAQAKHQCDKCGRGFPTKQKLTRHAATHEPRPCPEPGCGQVLATYTLLRAHMAEHNKRKKARVVPVAVEERKGFPCDFPGCTKSFTLKKNLRAHKRASHEDVRFACPFPQCAGKSFRYKCTLDKHLTRVHVDGEGDQDEEEPSAEQRLMALPAGAPAPQYRALLLETLMGGVVAQPADFPPAPEYHPPQWQQEEEPPLAHAGVSEEEEEDLDDLSHPATRTGIDVSA